MVEFGFIKWKVDQKIIEVTGLPLKKYNVIKAWYLVNIYKQKKAILIEILLTLGANYFDLEGKLSRVIFHCFG